jgi:hypothetical protein
MPTNIINNDQAIIDQLKSEINIIKDNLKEEGISTDKFDLLTKSAKILQDKLEQVMNKGGILTEKEKQDVYTTIQNTKRGDMAKMSAKSKRNLYLYLGIFVLVGVAIYVYTKKSE